MMAMVGGTGKRQVSVFGFLEKVNGILIGLNAMHALTTAEDWKSKVPKPEHLKRFTIAVYKLSSTQSGAVQLVSGGQRSRSTSQIELGTALSCRVSAGFRIGCIREILRGVLILMRFFPQSLPVCIAFGCLFILFRFADSSSVLGRFVRLDLPCLVRRFLLCEFRLCSFRLGQRRSGEAANHSRRADTHDNLQSLGVHVCR